MHENLCVYMCIWLSAVLLQPFCCVYQKELPSEEGRACSTFVYVCVF